MKYRVVTLFMFVFIVSTMLVGCGNSKQEVINEFSHENVKYTTDILYDDYNNPIQKTIYDNESGYTYICTFTYDTQFLGQYTCINSSVTILDEKGNVITK